MVVKEAIYDKVAIEEIKEGDVVAAAAFSQPSNFSLVTRVGPWFVPVAPKDWSKVVEAWALQLVHVGAEPHLSLYTGRLGNRVYRLRSEYLPDYLKKHKTSVQQKYSKFLPYLYPTCVTGTDPEIFITDKAGVIIPAFRFLPDKGGVGIFNDGFQAEFVTDASHCHERVVESIYFQLSGLQSKMRKHSDDTKFSINSVMQIPAEVLEDCTEKQLELGCDPSLNAYDMVGRLDEAVTMPLRVAGGHIHFGMHEGQTAQAKRVIQFLDATLGICTVSMAAQLDDPIRRRYYGLAGEYRLPKHGLEYRTLSNFWLCAPYISHLTLDLARAFVAMSLKGLGRYWEAEVEEVVETINNCDVAQARGILGRNILVLRGILKAIYTETPAIEAEKVILNGVESFVKDPTAIEENWRLGQWKGHITDRGRATWSGRARGRAEAIPTPAGVDFIAVHHYPEDLELEDTHENQDLL